MESADSMTVIPLGVVQFNSFEDSRATIKQTVADRIWLLNGVSSETKFCWSQKNRTVKSDAM